MRNLSLPELINTIGEQERNKRDYLAESNQLTIKTEHGLSHVIIPAGRSKESFVLNETARIQLADRLDIPYRYAEHLRMEHPEILDNTVNNLFKAHAETRLLRTMGNQCRAILSPKYRILDNYNFVGSVLPLLAEVPDTEVKECRISDTHLQICLTFQKAQSAVQPGDIVHYGVILQNSEVGIGSLSVMSYIWRLVCSNGMVAPSADGPALRRFHRGKRIEDLSRLPSDREVWLTFQDYMRQVSDRNKFPEILNKLRIAANTPLEKFDPAALVDILAKRFQLTNDESGVVLTQYIAGKDQSLWGLTNAITETAKLASTLQRRVELQTIGGKISLVGNNGGLLKAA